MPKICLGAGAVGLALVLAGCGDRMAEVTGSVSFNGVPIENGAITFIPEDGKSSTAGSEIKDGKYAARVPLGMMKVTISGAKVKGYKALYPSPNSPKMPVTEELLPAEFNTESTLRYEVKPGKNPKDFELRSK